MQVFKTDKKIFWMGELKSWFWTFALAALLYFGFSFFLPITSGNIYLWGIVILALKLADTFTQKHLVEIQIDKPNNQLIFVLKSVMSGGKIKRYELDQVTAELIRTLGLKKYLSSPFILNIFVNRNDMFRVTNRYGFSQATLTSIGKVINS